MSDSKSIEIGQLEGLEKDRIRLNWLGVILPTVYTFASGRIRVYDDGKFHKFDASSMNIRTAVDRAMQQEKEWKP